MDPQTRTYALKIKNFLRRTAKSTTAAKHMANRLRNASLVKCTKERTCFGFGNDKASFKKYFHYYNFDFLHTTGIRQIGNGKNGSVYLLPFRRMEIDSTLVMKMVYSQLSDNLFYEGIVGLTINKFVPFFPCFVETYGCFKSTDAFFKKLKRNVPLTRDDMKSLTPLFYFGKKISDEDALEHLRESCGAKRLYFLLCETVNVHASRKFTSVYEVWRKNVTYLTANHLFQVYSVLDVLFEKHHFQHNDLHAGNVMVLWIPNNNYITIRYHYEDGDVVVVKTQSVMKIIDYGRVTVDGLPADMMQEVESWGDDVGSDCGFFAQQRSDRTFYEDVVESTPEVDFHQELETNAQIHAFLKEMCQSEVFLKEQEAHLSNSYEVGVMNVYLDMSKPLVFRTKEAAVPLEASISAIIEEEAVPVPKTLPEAPSSWRCAIS